jgi:hypothetical protein
MSILLLLTGAMAELLASFLVDNNNDTSKTLLHPTQVPIVSLACPLRMPMVTRDGTPARWPVVVDCPMDRDRCIIAMAGSVVDGGAMDWPREEVEVVTTTMVHRPRFVLQQ